MSNPEYDFEFDHNALALARQERLRKVMRQQNVPVVLILDSVNILYATGASNMPIFSIRTPARYLLLIADGPSILYDYFGCEHLSNHLPTIDDVRPARGLCHVSSNADPQTQAIAMAAEISFAVRDAGLEVDQLAVDRFPYHCIDALRAEGFYLSDADSIFSQARRIKLPGEITLLREALNRVAAAAGEMEAKIEPGRSETEIWAEFSRSFVANEGRYLTTRLLQSGTHTYPYFQEAGAHKMESGDLLCFDTDAVGYAGYCTDFSRTYLCGDEPASTAQKDLYRKAYEQLEHNISLIKPGVSYQQIGECAWPIPPEHNASRYYCIGHGLGMSGEFPNIPHSTPGQEYPIEGEVEVGMVLCIESYIGSEKSGQGVKLEDQLLVTELGIKRMSEMMTFDDRLLTKII